MEKLKQYRLEMLFCFALGLLLAGVYVYSDCLPANGASVLFIVLGVTIALKKLNRSLDSIN